MTIECGPIFLRALRFFGAAVFVVLTWFAGLALVTLLVEPMHGAVAFNSGVVTMTRESSRLVDVGKGYVIVRGERAGFVRDLYAEGAWLVLPTTAGGCRGARRFSLVGTRGRVFRVN